MSGTEIKVKKAHKRENKKWNHGLQNVISQTYLWSAMPVQEFVSLCAVLGVADFCFLFVLWKIWDEKVRGCVDTHVNLKGRS